MPQQPLLPWDEFDLGSNVFRNTPGVLIAYDEELIKLERAGVGDQLLLTMDVYVIDGTGVSQRVAKLRRNAWVFNDGRYHVTTAPRSLTLTDTASGTTVVEASIQGPARVKLPRGLFYTQWGNPIDVEPQRVVIDRRLTMSGSTIVNCRRGIIIDPNGIGLGGG